MTFIALVGIAAVVSSVILLLGVAMLAGVGR
jgi:hypothetical protein